MPHSQQHIPPESATPQERRKFWLLVLLAGILVVLLWVALLPLSLRNQDRTTSGPQSFFQKLGEQFSLTGVIFNKTREVESAITEKEE